MYELLLLYSNPVLYVHVCSGSLCVLYVHVCSRPLMHIFPAPIKPLFHAPHQTALDQKLGTGRMADNDSNVYMAKLAEQAER